MHDDPDRRYYLKQAASQYVQGNSEKLAIWRSSNQAGQISMMSNAEYQAVAVAVQQLYSIQLIRSNNLSSGEWRSIDSQLWILEGLDCGQWHDLTASIVPWLRVLLQVSDSTSLTSTRSYHLHLLIEVSTRCRA